MTGIVNAGGTFPIVLLPDSTGEFLHFDLGLLTAQSNDIPLVADVLETAGGPVSDRLLVTVTPGSLQLDVKFASDPASIVLPPGMFEEPPPIVEDGTFQTPLGFGFTGGTFYTFQVRSDVGDRTDVPEPATIVLLASGAAGLGAIAWRRRRR